VSSIADGFGLPVRDHLSRGVVFPEHSVDAAREQLPPRKDVSPLEEIEGVLARTYRSEVPFGLSLSQDYVATADASVSERTRS
jgi:hypothetical protein